MRLTSTPLHHFTRLTCLVLVFVASRDVVASPQPISVPTGPDFLGYDGSWSPIALRVGNPEQWVYVLPNTVSSELEVIGQDGCDGTLTCQSERGGLFLANESSTFKALGSYEMGFDVQLGNRGAAYYGSDSIAFNDVLSVPKQLMGVVNSTDFWLGELGLSVVESRLEGTQNQLSLLSSLVESAGLIPSHSYGYTAGASYRQKGFPASLTLGGVDASRFASNNAEFTLAQDYVPVLAINAISMSASTASPFGSEPVTLLTANDSDLFTIDSSTPFFWMPEVICDNFAKALNLTYDDGLQLYLYDSDTSLSSLANWNLTFTFSLGNEPGTNGDIEIVIPFDAFDLALTYPFPNLEANYSSTPTSYFPLRRASNSTQYTIGRAFLQEAFLQVDYERNNFAVFQAAFATEPNILAITRPEDSTWPGPLKHSSITAAAKVGIGIGAAVFISVLTAILLLFFMRRRKFGRVPSQIKLNAGATSLFARFKRTRKSHRLVPELHGDKRQPHEIQSVARFELATNNLIEMPAHDVPISFLQTNTPRQELPGTDLARQSSTSKDVFVAITKRSESPAPAYTPAASDPAMVISPADASSIMAPGTHESSEQGISPLGTNTKESFGRGVPFQVSPISPSQGSTLQSPMPNFQTPFSVRGDHDKDPPRAHYDREQKDELTGHKIAMGPHQGRPRFSWE